MKVLPVSLSLLAAAINIQMAVGLWCPSGCAACWKIDLPGVDIKLYCDLGDCGYTCPSDYDYMHCAKTSRCMYVNLLQSRKLDLTKCSNSCQEPNCGDLEPCVCGTEIDEFGPTRCKRAPLGGVLMNIKSPSISPR